MTPKILQLYMTVMRFSAKIFGKKLLVERYILYFKY